MEALCASGHRWSVRPAVLAVGESWACPVCGYPAVIVERARGLEIQFTVPADVHVVSGVLLVDGNERRRDALAAVIDASAHLSVMAHAADGLDALELAALVRPDAVVLAERMPCLDGLACLPLLHDAAPDALIVFHAARLGPDLVQWCCDRGADACIDENVVAEVAVPTLERLLGHTTAALPVVGAALRRPA